MNKYPLWKNLLLLIVLLFSVVYAVPNLFCDTPAIQISSSVAGESLLQNDLDKVKDILNTNHLNYKSAILKDENILIRFNNTDDQLVGKAALKKSIGNKYVVALSLQTSTPSWLLGLGASPMKLGLDLRGGVHFLLQVDVDSVIKRREKTEVRNIGEQLRKAHVRYTSIAPLRNGGISIHFRDRASVISGEAILENNFPEFSWKSRAEISNPQLIGTLLLSKLQKINEYTIQQTMTTLRRRVNELGVSEAVVQQQGKDRISVDLPGIQDAAEAKNILGKTATLEFHLVDMQNSSNHIDGLVPSGDTLYDFHGAPILLKSRIVLTGDSITDARASFDQTGRPMVGIRLGGGGESLFERVTAENIGNSMSVVYVEIRSHQVKVNGKTKIIYKKIRKIINVATIQSVLGTNFQITGLSSPAESRNLALLLRAGALPAAVTIVEERTIGPSMGQQNIHMGLLSVGVGLLLAVIFMLMYYRVFGLIANIGLVVNLIILVALLSILGATLTFPGIAGIVLTVGMAVDANVLIYERIREELRLGMTPQVAIHAGYERAFVTIVDANITTLLVAMILFALGTGAVKGFAITLTLGLLASMLSAIAYTRAIVNFIYGGRRVKSLSIGIKIKGE